MRCSVAFGLLTVAALGVALLATLSEGQPTLTTQWSFSGIGTDVVLASQGVVLLSSQTEVSGAYTNTVQAVNQTSLWTLQSTGQVAVFTTAAAFDAIPKLVFLVVNNVQPPNVTAVIPGTGTVVWSTPGAFLALAGGTLVASIDGQTLYLSTYSPAGVRQLTAMDSSSGQVLFTDAAPPYWTVPTRCWPYSSGCLATMNATAALHAKVVFKLARSGEPVATLNLPSYTTVRRFTVAGPDLLLAIGYGALYMLNTTNYTVQWSGYATAAVQLMPLPAWMDGPAVVEMNMQGIYAFSADTGSLLWNATASSICPFASPAPGYATSFAYDQYYFAPLPPGDGDGERFLILVSCFYNQNNQQLNVLGTMNITNGDLTHWRYLSYFPSAAPVPLSPSYFLLPPQQSYYNRQSFYDADMHLLGEYPPQTYGRVSSYFVDGDSVVFSYWNGNNGYSQVVVTTVADTPQ